MQIVIAIFRINLLVLPLSFFIVSAGCSYQAWYEGFRNSARQQCYQSRSKDEIQSCLERIDDMDYEEYQKTRDK